MVTVVSNYCQLSQTQLSQTFAEKFTVTEELLQSLKKTALSGDEESIELLHNIALGYDKFGKEAEDILYHIVRTPTNETLSIIRLIKNACLKLYNLAHIATGFAPIFPDICYHLTHYKPAAADIPVASDNPAHYADAIRYNARTPLQGSLLPLTRLVWA